jgi:alkylation response protein AidB-like acyl-CoA dehydrogenase
MGAVLHPNLVPDEAIAVGEEIGRLAAPSAAAHDRDGTFVTEGYDAIRKLSYGNLAIPRELGGGGHGLDAICRSQAAIAHGCASTSLAIAMHQHAVLTMAWRRSRGDREVEPVLRRVARDGLILAASGTLNPAMITVDAQPGDGGFFISGRRRLCSGSPGADVLVTAARLKTPSGPRPFTVLAPLRGPGVEIVDDWDAMGMRGSGTNSVEFVDAFVPAENAMYVGGRGFRFGPRAGQGAPVTGTGDGSAVSRPGTFRGIFMPGLHISLAVIAAAYLGAADAAGRAAIRQVAGTGRADGAAVPRLIGLMLHEIRTGWWTLEGMVRQTTDESLGTREQMITTMLGKRQIILGAIHAAELCMEVLGSASYMRGGVFERTLRDVRAGITHPLGPDPTLVEVGRSALDAAAASLG